MKKYGLSRALCLGALVFVAATAQSITFFDIAYTASPLTDGANEDVTGNSISFFTPHAIVGDTGTDGLRHGVFDIEYSADAGVGVVAIEAIVTLHQALKGTATIHFEERVYELLPDDSIGDLVGSASETFFADFVGSWFQTLHLTRAVQRVRVVKSFEMNAPDSDDLDFASLALVNQNLQVVPEPATMAALGLGALGLLRRRNRKS